MSLAQHEFLSFWCLLRNYEFLSKRRAEDFAEELTLRGEKEEEEEGHRLKIQRGLGGGGGGGAGGGGDGGVAIHQWMRRVVDGSGGLRNLLNRKLVLRERRPLSSACKSSLARDVLLFGQPKD